MGLCGSVLVGLRLLIEHIPHHLIGVEGLGGVADHGDGQLRMKAQEVRDGLQGYMSRLHQRIVVDTGADGREGHRAAAVLQRQRQAAAVAGGQLGGLPAAAPRQMGPGVWITYRQGRS